MTDAPEPCPICKAEWHQDSPQYWEHGPQERDCPFVALLHVDDLPTYNRVARLVRDAAAEVASAEARGRREALEERERFEQRTAILRAELEAWRRLCDRLVKTLADERAMQPPAPIIFDVSGTGEERSPR